MDTYEVAAIGDLYKKNLGGRKTWNLREFALTGVQLIYYKKGVKRGEWDISGCKIRKITAQEAEQQAAKFAFVIEGNEKQYMLSANNEKNREMWINVLEKQIHEFRNPVRRFIRTGEIVHANGFVKRKNLFGKTPVLLVVTNFPRIIEIDPATIELINQYTWASNAGPVFTKISDSKLKIVVNGKDLRFEDPANGMAYWEALFARVHRIELWSPAKQPTLRIGFPGSKPPAQKASTPSMRIEKKPETSKDLKFLEEALAHINELLGTLNSKIEEIDLAFAVSVQNGQENEDAAQLTQDRQLKRTQLLMLKENIDVIADNLKSLIQRSKQTGSALFDVAAIESVISEAATLLVLLNSDEEDDEQQEEDYPEEVKAIDDIIQDLEQDNNVVNEKFEKGEVEAGSEIKPEIIAAVNKQAAVAARDPITELEINAKTFNPKSDLRPEGWEDAMMKRVLRREQEERNAGIDEDYILETRQEKKTEEDRAMCAEVGKHGKVLGLKEGGRGRSATLQQDVSLFDINSDNFELGNPNKRPHFWTEIRTKRVMLKEHIERISGTAESIIVEQRPIKEKDEELVLAAEVVAYDRLLNVGEFKNPYTEKAKILINANTYNESKKPAGWDAVREKRVQFKELEDRLDGVEESSIAAKREQRIADENTLMVGEAAQGFIYILGPRHAAKKIEAASTAASETVEEADIRAFINRPATVIEEPVQYSNQKIKFGNLSLEDTLPTPPPAASNLKAAATTAPVKAPAAAAKASAPSPKAPVEEQPVTRNRKASMEISQQDLAQYNHGKGGAHVPGWAEIKLRRVYLKEWEDRKNGVDEDDILDKRYQRELEAEQEMLAELGVRGKIALFEKGVRAPVKKVSKQKTKEEFASFLAASNASLANINSNISKVVVNK